MRNRLIKILLTFLFIFSFFSCQNDALDKKFNKETFIGDLADIKKSKVLSVEDFELLLNKITDADINNEDLTGKTFKTILKKARKEYSKEPKNGLINIDPHNLPGGLVH